MENSRRENPNYFKKLENIFLKNKRGLHQRVGSGQS
jgi:hypothetical protein